MPAIPFDSHRGFYFPPDKLLWPSADDQTESLWDFLSDWKNSEQQHAFLHSNIEESTFHHLRWSPSLSREENVLQAFLFLAFLFLRFRKVEEV